MRKNTVLSMSDCVLLNRSDQIRNDEEYSFLLPFLEDEKKITSDEMKQSGVLHEKIDKFMKNKGNIISLSSKEWAPRKVNATVHKPGKCQFCGQPLKYRYYVINGRNNNEMYVGGDCVGYFSSDAQYTHQSNINNLIQLKNKEYLEKNHIELTNEFNDNEFLYSQDTIVLKELEKEYNEVKKEFRNLYNSIIKNRTKAKIEKIKKRYSDLTHIKAEIIESCRRISKNEFVLNKGLYTYLRKDKGFNLAIETAKISGSPAPPTIQNIKYMPFLQEFENKFNKMNKEKLIIKFNDEDKLVFKMLFKDQEVVLNMKTEVILGWFNKIIIGEKHNDFYSKISLFTKKVENPKDVINAKELYNYFEKKKKLVRIDKNKLNSKSTSYNEYIFSYFNTKVIYKIKGRSQVYVLDDIEILRTSIILLVQNETKTFPNKHQQRKIEYKEYNSIKELKEKLRESYEIRKSFSSFS